MVDFEKTKVEIIRSMNENSFVYIGEGLIEVESFIISFLSERGFKFENLKVEENPGNRRHLRLYCKDIQYFRGYFMDITICGEQY
jgi:hypothetical protein